MLKRAADLAKVATFFFFFCAEKNETFRQMPQLAPVHGQTSAGVECFGLAACSHGRPNSLPVPVTVREHVRRSQA